MMWLVVAVLVDQDGRGGGALGGGSGGGGRGCG